MNGDITVNNLGLSAADVQTVVTNVHIVVHLAASVSFNEPLDVAAEVQNCKFIHYKTSL